MKTLVINTYGGSLLLGAKALGLEIIGSYEDTGFGMPIQQANFPELNFIPFRKDWPAQDLSETFVIAHPPCSAFSVQNNNPKAKGTDSAAFACTKSVLQYAVDNGAVGIAIESVVGALAGAWPIHQHYADAYGYNLYRILENGCMFGAQWRDRFWVVYIKKGAAPDIMPWTLKPRFETVRSVVGKMVGPSPAGLDEELQKLKNRFIEEAGCTPDEIRQIFETNVEEMESVDGRLHALKFKDQVRWDVCKQYVTKYASSAMVHLAPDGLCPVLLGSSGWYMDSRNLSEVAYKRLMGFPDEYVFPEGDSGRKKDNYRIDMRTYLSKGVMPPIATWVLENSLTHLGALPRKEYVSAAGQLKPFQYNLEIGPDFIADFRIRKKTWGEYAPALRHEDENGVAKNIERQRQPASVTVEVQAPGTPRVKPEKAPRVKPERMPRVPGIPRSKSPWNAPEIETSLAETLFVRPNTADAYALHESHGYHRMGVKAGDIVLDLGAHIGCVASRAALVGASKIICIEAEPENFELLQKNTQTFPQVVAIHGAVFGGDSETVQLNTVQRRTDGGHSTGTHSCYFRTRGNTIPVPRLDFRKLLEEHQPTVLKVDIEGSEWSLDFTNLPASIRSIGIEFHTRNGQMRDEAKALLQVLTDQGFKPVHALNMESNFSAIVGFLSRETAVIGSPVEQGRDATEVTEQASAIG